MKIYLYPGGHTNYGDNNPLHTAKRGIIEETGLNNLKQLKLSKNELIPIDIDTYKINYNKRLNLPEHCSIFSRTIY